MEAIRSAHRSIMNMFFTHTYLERKMWRGWFKNGQALEISFHKHSWSFGIDYIYLDEEDEYLKSRLLFLHFYKLVICIPLGFKVIHEIKEVSDKLRKLYQERNVIERSNRNLGGNDVESIEKLSKIKDELEPLRKESHDLNRKYEDYELPEYEFKISKEFGIMLHFYKWSKTIRLPWDWHQIDREIYLKDNTWKSSKEIDMYDDPDNLIYKESHPYIYTLRNGKMQERIATINVERRHLTYAIFKPKWLRRFKFLNWIKQSIHVKFDGEVGEDTGSWKGGCIGTGYDLLPNETPKKCLRRMEATEKF